MTRKCEWGNGTCPEDARAQVAIQNIGTDMAEKVVKNVCIKHYNEHKQGVYDLAKQEGLIK